MSNPVSEEKPTSSRNWKSYFFEFLMLFLAVTLGFFVENQRENYNERQQEEEYMHMILEDIQTDLTEGDQRLKQWENLQLSLDTLLKELTSPDVINNSNRAYRVWKKNIAYSSFMRNDRTIVQLKNNGGLRLIRNQPISDAIMKYDQLIRKVYSQQDLLDKVLADQQYYLQLFDFIALDKNGINGSPVPLKSDKHILNQAYERQKIWRLGISILIDRYTVARAQAEETSKLIRDNY